MELSLCCSSSISVVWCFLWVIAVWECIEIEQHKKNSRKESAHCSKQQYTNYKLTANGDTEKKQQKFDLNP